MDVSITALLQGCHAVSSLFTSGEPCEIPENFTDILNIRETSIKDFISNYDRSMGAGGINAEIVTSLGLPDNRASRILTAVRRGYQSTTEISIDTIHAAKGLQSIATVLYTGYLPGRVQTSSDHPISKMKSVGSTMLGLHARWKPCAFWITSIQYLKPLYSAV